MSGDTSKAIACVLGADVSKSRSPAIHNAAFRALGVKGIYTRLNVDARRFSSHVHRFRAEGFRYLNITIPHKLRAAKLASKRYRGAEVRVSGAANTLIFDGNQIRAENTDGAGLLAALDDLGFSPRGETVVLVGAGGAAAGGIEALTRMGARVKLLPRRISAGRRLLSRLSKRQQKLVEVYGWEEELEHELKNAAALVSAVPAYAWQSDDRLAGLRSLTKNTVVLEMAYGATTPLAQAARRRTDRYADGLGMLVHQAARAIELALGKKPPLPPLFRAARRGG
jgi:shikimate dehydrogenase